MLVYIVATLIVTLIACLAVLWWSDREDSR